ncbi:uncharacterized protein LOC131584060 [Poecile atricapillus]|uniref:uncharacterized protein LOC131584060 n=1 Tax=Poecile atricapillus TaxID=48891 RepID=UPI0027384ED7|nr:uncharacterized protein LOC131584060 [Poecile atricapillus]
MSGSISIIMSNEDLSCPVNYLYFRLNQEKKKPNSTVLKCRNNVSFATQVGRENEIAQQQQQPLQYSSQPLAISPVGLEWGWHRFVVKPGRHPCDHGGSHLSRTLESGSLSQPWQLALHGGPGGRLRSAAAPVATWPPHRHAGRGVPSAERWPWRVGPRSCGDTLGRGAGGHPQGGPVALTAACHPGHGARRSPPTLPQGSVGPRVLWAPLVAPGSAGQGPAWGSPASGFSRTAVPRIVKTVVTVTSCHR